MRIGMVLAPHPFPPDIRVEKEAAVLAEGGHEVFVLCKRRDGEAAIEPLEHSTAVRHRVHPESTLARKIDSARYLLTLDSPSWRRAIEDLVRVHGAQALHVHDLPYAASALKAARDLGVPLVLDLHENYPVALSLYRRSLMRRVMFSPARAARLERRAVADADQIIVVVDEARDRLAANGTDPGKISVFGNLEPRALAEPDPPSLLAGPGPKIVYVGGVAAHRGLDTALDAMPAIVEALPDATLTIVGDGDFMPDLKRQADSLGIQSAVRLAGRLPFAEAMQVVKESDIGLVPHHRSPHTDATIPHKLFQYMAIGRPVIVSDCLPLARIVNATGSGGVFRSGDAADLARRVIELADPEVGREAGRKGRQAVLDSYNAEADAPALLRVYERIAGKFA